MTPQEQKAIEDYSGRILETRPVDEHFVVLKTGPCPLLEMQGDIAVCTVHPVRPYNCRRFSCFRPDPKTEPLVLSNRPPLYCENVNVRFFKDREVRRELVKTQRKAMRWALKHGWHQRMQ